MTTAQRIRSTLTELRAGIRRVDQRALEADDGPVVRAFYAKEIARSERRLELLVVDLAIVVVLSAPVLLRRIFNGASESR